MKRLHSFVNKLITRPLLSIALILVIKGVLSFYLVHLFHCNAPATQASVLAFEAGDTYTYIGAMENFVIHGEYYFDNGVTKVYAGRVPHYAIPYWFFRIFFNREVSLNLMVIFQYLVESISIYYLGLTAWRITSSITGFALVVVIALAALNATAMAMVLSPESLSCSLLIFTIYFYTSYRITEKTRSFVGMAIALALLTTLKSYYIIFFGVIGCEMLYRRKFNIQASAKLGLLLIAPLILLLLPWVIRNYTIYDRFIPLQVDKYAGYSYTEADLAYRRYLRAWGGDFIFWERKSAGCYFLPHEGIPCDFQLPEYVFTSRYKRDNIDALRSKFIELHQHYSPELDRAIAKQFEDMRNDFKNEKPLRYYFISPLLLTKQFLVHSGSYYLPIQRTSPCYHHDQFVMKVSQSVIYWLALLIGIPGLLLAAVHGKGLLLPSLPIALIILFPLVLGFAEARYFRTIEPALYVGITYVVIKVVERLKKDNIIGKSSP